MPDDEGFELPPDVLGQIPLFAEIAKVLAWQGGPVNWDIARQVATAVAGREGGSRPVAAPEVEELAADVRVAELWIADATGIAASAVAHVHAVSPAELAARTLEGWRELVDPLARRVSESLAAAPPGAEGLEAQMMSQALGQIAPFFLGLQAGVAIGSFAAGALGRSDLAVPASDESSIEIVGARVDAFADEFGIERREARLWTALHETAHRLEYEALGWVSAHFFSLYHNYVAALHFDMGGIMERLAGLDVSDPAGLQDALGDQGIFSLVGSPEMERALGGVQHFLAVIEAWGDRAVEAGAERLASGARLAEASARRRAEASRGERMLRQFIGLWIEPERRRAADAFTRAVLGGAGWAGLNRMWADPETLPREEELGDAGAWMGRAL